MQADGYLSIRQTAALAAVSEKTVRRAVAAGELRAFRLGSRWRFRCEDVVGWVEAEPVQPQRPPAGGLEAIMRTMRASGNAIHDEGGLADWNRRIEEARR